MTNFRKRELLLYYGVGYLIIAVIETFWFTILIGSWTFRDFMLNFSLWGITWLVSLFVFPLFFTDANPNKIALNPYLSLLGYLVIIVVYYLTYRYHKRKIEQRIGKTLNFNKLIDLYFPVKKSSSQKSSSGVKKVREEEETTNSKD